MSNKNNNPVLCRRNNDRSYSPAYVSDNVKLKDINPRININEPFWVLGDYPLKKTVPNNLESFIVANGGPEPDKSITYGEALLKTEKAAFEFGINNYFIKIQNYNKKNSSYDISLVPLEKSKNVFKKTVNFFTRKYK